MSYYSHLSNPPSPSSVVDEILSILGAAPDAATRTRLEAAVDHAIDRHRDDARLDERINARVEA